MMAEWFRNRAPSLALPWLKARTRWGAVAGEIVLDRAPSKVIRRVWPVLNMLDAVDSRDSVADDLHQGLLDMTRTVGRLRRAETALSLAKDVSLLDGPADEIKRATGISEAIADLAVLVVPQAATDGLIDEPVLAAKGVLRVARRFQANAVDRKNKLTDGRMAVARMVGFGANARDAHLGLIELANSLCRPENPLCSQCPLSAHCARDGV
jgi:DNA (cytosine-5)-methyltransferase 1